MQRLLAGEILKRRFNSTVWPTAHTNPSRKRNVFENASLTFLRGRKTF